MLKMIPSSSLLTAGADVVVCGRAFGYGGQHSQQQMQRCSTWIVVNEETVLTINHHSTQTLQTSVPQKASSISSGVNDSRNRQTT